jgi:hypothetical protein
MGVPAPREDQFLLIYSANTRLAIAVQKCTALVAAEIQIAQTLETFLRCEHWPVGAEHDELVDLSGGPAVAACASAGRAGGSPITSRPGSEKVSMRRYAWVIWPTPISRSAHRPDSGQDGREPCLSGVPRHSQDSRRAHRSCLPDAWNRILEIRFRYQRRRMTLRPFSPVTSASVPSREPRQVLHYFQYQHWCRELAVVRG